MSEKASQPGGFFSGVVAKMFTNVLALVVVVIGLLLIIEKEGRWVGTATVRARTSSA
jgi:hypothetical protein